MYKQCYDGANKVIANSVIRTVDGACIPFDPANTDYAEFKKAVTEGAELQDSEGNVITDAQAFVATLR